MDQGILIDDVHRIIWGYLCLDGKPRYVMTTDPIPIGSPDKLYHFIKEYPISHHFGDDEYMGCWIGQKSIICPDVPEVEDD